jgi:hypothetical protein
MHAQAKAPKAGTFSLWHRWRACQSLQASCQLPVLEVVYHRAVRVYVRPPDHRGGKPAAVHLLGRLLPLDKRQFGSKIDLQNLRLGPQ